MRDAERDNTDDWLVPSSAQTPTMRELEQRVDVALAVARSAESAALEIGAAAFDAADQARRAAEFAEWAVGAVTPPPERPLADDREPSGVDEDPGPEAIDSDSKSTPGRSGGLDHDERLRLFSERADRVMVRLRALEPAT